MPKPIPKRQPAKILVVFIDETADKIRHIRAWALDPNRLTLDKQTTFWGSEDIIEGKLAIRTIIDKMVHFMKSINETGTHETLPLVVFWDYTQKKRLMEYIPTFDNLVKGTVFLQERCRDIFKYDLRVQNYSLQEIAEVLCIDHPLDCVKMVKIAHAIEWTYKASAKTLRKDAKQQKTENTKEAGQEPTATDGDTRTVQSIM